MLVSTESSIPVQGPQPLMLSLPEGQIAYDLVRATAPDAPLVICVPGMGDLRGEYRLLVPALVEAGYSVATMDLRGHGQSSVGFSDHSPAAVGSDVVALIDALKSNTVYVIGDSMAAAAAVWAAAERPAQTKAIILAGPFVRDPPPNRLMQWLFAALLARPWGARVWSWFYKTLYPTKQPADFAEYQQALRENMAQPGRLEALQAMSKASKSACETRLPEVKARSLVLMGTRDPDFAYPAKEAQWIKAQLGSEVVMVEGAGHYPHAEMPELVGPKILQFLSSIKG